MWYRGGGGEMSVSIIALSFQEIGTEYIDNIMYTKGSRPHRTQPRCDEICMAIIISIGIIRPMHISSQ